MWALRRRRHRASPQRGWPLPLPRTCGLLLRLSVVHGRGRRASVLLLLLGLPFGSLTVMAAALVPSPPLLVGARCTNQIPIRHTMRTQTHARTLDLITHCLCYYFNDYLAIAVTTTVITIPFMDCYGPHLHKTFASTDALPLISTAMIDCPAQLWRRSAAAAAATATLPFYFRLDSDFNH